MHPSNPRGNSHTIKRNIKYPGVSFFFYIIDYLLKHYSLSEMTSSFWSNSVSIQKAQEQPSDTLHTYLLTPSSTNAQQALFLELEIQW